MLCLSSSVTLCIVAKRCVLDQKLLLTAYRKSYMRNQLVDLCLDVYHGHVIASHSLLNISDTDTDTEFYYTLAAISRIAE